jgi:hypothetical protein
MDLADTGRTVTERESTENTGKATESNSATSNMEVGLSITSDDETLIEDTNPGKNDTISLDDWSETGRGSHVDFTHDESVPIEQGT